MSLLIPLPLRQLFHDLVDREASWFLLRREFLKGGQVLANNPPEVYRDRLGEAIADARHHVMTGNQSDDCDGVLNGFCLNRVR